MGFEEGAGKRDETLRRKDTPRKHLRRDQEAVASGAAYERASTAAITTATAREKSGTKMVDRVDHSVPDWE